MQYQRYADGRLEPLPKPSVDTGMGLERIAAVMQGVHSNYEIDLFQSLLKAAMVATGSSDIQHNSLRVIADHIRSCAFLIVDGVIPSNEGRGYVLRRIIRRAVRHGHKLGQNNAFFYQLVPALVKEMGSAYPELKKQQTHVEKVLLAEEQQFAKTLEKGMAVLEDALKDLEGSVLPGELVFTLHDTYGFPTDLTNDIARERNLTLDLEGFERCMAEQRSRSSAASQFNVDYTRVHQIGGETHFEGYESVFAKGSIVGILVDGEPVEEVEAEQDCVLILDRTPFYGESGGQVGDTGYIESKGGRFEVRDCQKSGDHHLHIGKLLKGRLKLGDEVHSKVDGDVRQATALNHSATHLLHAALRQVLGEHVTQKGSLVDSDRLRFDFGHMQAVTADELAAIEKLVNDHIRANTEVRTELTDVETARQKGALMLFGEKYGEQVRVLTMGEGFSVELCGGTHVRRTGDIGLMRIVSESGIAAGVRRIEAVTGVKALQLYDEQEELLQTIGRLLKTSPERSVEKLEQLLSAQRQTEKELAGLKSKLASASSDDLLEQARQVGDLKVLAAQVDGLDSAGLRSMVDQLKNKLGNGVVLLAAVEDSKVSLVAGVSKQATAQVKAGDLVRHAAGQLGGKGGGRPDMAQGGGNDVDALPAVLESIGTWVDEQLSR